MRMKSSLESKRVKTSPKFRLTMIYARLMARASKIGSVVYKALPAEFRQFWMYRAFTGEAMQWLKTGRTDEEVKKILLKTYAEVWEHKEKNKERQPACKKIIGRSLVQSKRVINIRSKISAVKINNLFSLSEVSNLKLTPGTGSRVLRRRRPILHCPGGTSYR